MIKTALSIAGSDPSGGAGIQADIKTFQAHQVFGMSVITGVSVQNTQKVFDIQKIKPRIVHDQITCLFDDININAIKIGMIPGIPVLEAIVSALENYDLPHVVYDPVIMSSSGYSFLDYDSLKEMKNKLFPFVSILTPNIHEAEILTGKKINSLKQMKDAARIIKGFGLETIVVKGGHMGTGEAVDIFYNGTDMIELKSPRVKTGNNHGTGCTFSSAIAANLALGRDFYNSIKRAKTYISKALEKSLNIGKGSGPVCHF
ncbi:Hydroxymethylpyrimidine/phosphomethylpyrimidine kinase [Desulfonema limicola]|uniref:hydroxymethylpyrimidine kinase n=1 Tax=Desulfonema limicola TaxID=45656 RepID=A0A975B338_9BACT|nr:bifunctional hydroxymethylpyrimidine kinase/phosphomethylpyrimidine kinase [Desulfonema limicola]QTA77896.1 Hydroxymethylpyrimidine/phosphomethylpyrimidine kinase [Desulfonema limicola]